MSQSSQFYKLCSCSLLSVRPHPVTSRVDWARHLAAQEQDRLDELFQTPGDSSEDQSSDGKQDTNSNSSSDGQAVVSAIEDPESSDTQPTRGREADSGNAFGDHIADQDSSDEHFQPILDRESSEDYASPVIRYSSDENVFSRGFRSPPTPTFEEYASPVHMEVESENPPSPEEPNIYATSGDESLYFEDDEAARYQIDMDEEQSSQGEVVMAGLGIESSVEDEVYNWRDFERGFPELHTPEDDGRPNSNTPIQSPRDVPHDEGVDGNISDDPEYDREDIDEIVGQMRRESIRLDEDDLVMQDGDGDGDGDESESESSEREEDLSSEEEIDEEAFPYGDRIPKLSVDEILSISIHDLKLTHRLSRAATNDITNLIDRVNAAGTGDTEAHCWDYRTTKKWIERETGVKAISYDCCKNSCMSFAMYPDKTECDYCEQPRWREGPSGKVPIATYEYIPVTHRLRLWYADPERAATLISYRRRAQTQGKLIHVILRPNPLAKTRTANHTDFWSSELFRELQQKGLFASSTDLGFLLSTDGVQIFKAKTKFSVWPVILECLNLPPTIRTKRQNILCTGFIPGPKTPSNLDSFLYPLVKEMESLQSEIGIPRTLNASIPASLPTSERVFPLRGHICLVGADMVAREKLMKVTGNRSYCYCEYCLAQGVWNRGMYCPFSPPTDTPIGARIRDGSRYPWATWDRRNLPLRNNEEFRRVATQMAKRGGTQQQRSKYGVRGLSILSRLSSIDFPRSFPPDSMHLWFENIIPDMVKHWRGKYRIDAPEAPEAPEMDGDGFEDVTESSESEEPSRKKRRGRQRGEKRKDPKRNREKKNQRAPRVKEPKVVRTDDPYNISLRDWETMSRDIAKSSTTFPLLFGPVLRNFLEHIHEMTAAEWQMFTFLLAPVYLKDLLPDEDYIEIISLIEAIQLSCDYELTEADFQEMDERIIRFSKYYETRYYRKEFGRLKSCLPVFHQIMHVPQALRWAGPMFVYSQWAMERFCGTLAGMAKSRVATNRNLSNNLIMLEQKNALVYVIDHGSPEEEDEDLDGNIRFSRFLTKRLKDSHPSEEKAPVRGNILLFLGPSKLKTLTTHERTSLKAFLLDEKDIFHGNDAEADADNLDIPAFCRSFRSVSVNTTRPGGYPFKSSSSVNRRSNQSRSTSLIRYEISVGGHTVSKFGEILFYFSVDISEECMYVPSETESLSPGARRTASSRNSIKQLVREKERGAIREKRANELLLAYIRNFPIARDGRLLYRSGKGVKRVISATSVRELIGFLEKDGKKYIVRKNTALF